MKKQVTTSKNYRQEGLKVSLKNGKMTIEAGKLIYDKEYEIPKSVSFSINEDTVIIFLVEDKETGKVKVAASDGVIDKSRYKLIERLAWKTETGWVRLQIESHPEPEKAGKYNYEGQNKKTIQRGLKIHQRRQKVVRPGGKVEFKNQKIANSKRKS